MCFPVAVYKPAANLNFPVSVGSACLKEPVCEDSPCPVWKLSNFSSQPGYHLTCYTSLQFIVPAFDYVTVVFVVRVRF